MINEAELDKALTDRADLKYITDIAAEHQGELNEKFGKRVFSTLWAISSSTIQKWITSMTIWTGRLLL